LKPQHPTLKHLSIQGSAGVLIPVHEREDTADKIAGEVASLGTHCTVTGTRGGTLEARFKAEQDCGARGMAGETGVDVPEGIADPGKLKCRTVQSLARGERLMRAWGDRPLLARGERQA